MSKYRDRYFKDVTVEEQSVPGRKRPRRVYLYHGDFYYWDRPVKTIRRYKWIYAALFCLNAVLYLLAAIRDTGANRAKYLSVPVLLTAAALMYGLYAIVHFCMAGEKLREFDFQEINTKLLGAAVSSAVLQFAGAAMSLYYALSDRTASGYFALAAELAVCGGCALTVFLMHRRLGSVLLEEGEGADRYKQRKYRQEAERKTEE